MSVPIRTTVFVYHYRSLFVPAGTCVSLIIYVRLFVRDLGALSIGLEDYIALHGSIRLEHLFSEEHCAFDWGFELERWKQLFPLFSSTCYVARA